MEDSFRGMFKLTGFDTLFGSRRLMVVGAIRQNQARQDLGIDLGGHASEGCVMHKVFYKHESIQ